MLIEALELQCLGPFRERLSVGPFAPGLNILAQHNEWGKSTLLKALTRALFDKYSSQSAEIAALRPTGSCLSPRVLVTFAAGGERWQLAKTFLDRKSSALSRWGSGAWQLIAESDKADQRVRELLGASKLEGRTVKPETWGLLRYLWAHQDDAPEWPKWEGAFGDEARRRLATVELDPTVRELVARLEAQRAVLLTDTGRTKAKGALDVAEQETKKLEAELAHLRERRAQSDSLQQQYARLLAEVGGAGGECSRLRVEADRLRTAAEAAEKLTRELETLQAAQTRAHETLQVARRDLEQEAALELSARELSTKCAERVAEAAAGEQRRPALEAAFSTAQKQLAEARQAATEATARLERMRALLRLRTATDEAAALRQQLARVQAVEAQIRALEAKGAALPAVTNAQLERWRRLQQTARENATLLESLGLSVTLLPEKTQRYSTHAERPLEIPGGGRETLKTPQTLTLFLEGWGTIEISSGAREIGSVEKARDEARAQLSRELSAAGIISIAEAEAAAQNALAAAQELKTARATLAPLLGEFPHGAALESACQRAFSTAEQQQRVGQPDAAESACTLTALRADEESLAALCRHASRTAETRGQELEAARLAVEEARRKQAAAVADEPALRAQIDGLRERQKMLRERHRGDLPAALQAAQEEFVSAEARLKVARAQLPADAAILPDRSQRAARAAAEAATDCDRKTQELRKLEGSLAERAGEGLYSQLATVEEKLNTARAAAERLREEGWALRLAAELIRRREQSAIQTVLAPLEDALTAALAELTGDRERRVFFDEHLAIRGVGRNAQELIPFEDLSRGTREQLLLALRAAIALEISKDEPTCLILDDVLVHTDAIRQQNVLDYLQRLAPRVQIVILTCHAERYRGVGHVLPAA